MSWSTPQTILRDNGTSVSGEDLKGKEGRLVYRKNSDGRYYLADAAGEDRGALGDGDMGGVVINGGSTGAAADRVVIGIGVVWALAAATITSGKYLTGETTDSDFDLADTSADIPLAFSLSGGADGERILIQYTGPTDEAVA